MNVRRSGAIALAAVVLAGCATANLRVATAPQSVCDDALASGQLVDKANGGLVLVDRQGLNLKVVWPFGYSASRELMGIAIEDETGRVVARVGDFIEAGGGLGEDDTFVICAGSVKVVPAPA